MITKFKLYESKYEGMFLVSKNIDPIYGAGTFLIEKYSSKFRNIAIEGIFWMTYWDRDTETFNIYRNNPRYYTKKEMKNYEIVTAKELFRNHTKVCMSAYKLAQDIIKFAGTTDPTNEYVVAVQKIISIFESIPEFLLYIETDKYNL